MTVKEKVKDQKVQVAFGRNPPPGTPGFTYFSPFDVSIGDVVLIPYSKGSAVGTVVGLDGLREIFGKVKSLVGLGVVEEREPQSRYEKFRDFHLASPEVFGLFQYYANKVKNTGRRVGARMIGERIRWYSNVEVEDTEYINNRGVKFNDHYWPYYARVLALHDTSFREFFEFRGGGSDVTDEQLIKECITEGMVA